MTLSAVNSVVDQFWAGALADTSFAVQCDLSAAVQSNIVVAEAADVGFSSPVKRSSVIPATLTANATGGNFFIAKHSVTGLNPNTAYRYAIESNGSRRPNGAGLIKTAPLQGVPAEFEFDFGSCANVNNTTLGLPSGSTDTCQAFENMAAESNSLFAGMFGDVPYDDYSGGLLTFKRSNARFYRKLRSLASTTMLVQAKPIFVSWSDHDAAWNDVTLDDAGYAAQIACSQAVFQEEVPSPTLDVANRGIGYSFWIGSCFFVVPDCYSFRRASTNVMLGTAQFNWIVSQVTSAVAAGATLIFLVSTPTWTNSALLGWRPTWAAEQTALLDALAAIPGDHGFVILEGDNHKYGVDDGGNTDFSTNGGMKIIRLLSSSFKNAATISDGAACVWNGVATTNTSWTRGYIHVAVDATGRHVTATIKGRTSGDGVFSTQGPYSTTSLAAWAA